MNSFRSRREKHRAMQIPNIQAFPRVIPVLSALLGYRAIVALERLLIPEAFR
jgi:hypothetical protein